MGFNIKKGIKAIGKDISGMVSGTKEKIEKYQAEAPERRRREIKKLKDDIQLEKLKAQKRKLRAAGRTDGPSITIGMEEERPKKKQRYGLF